MTTSLPRAIESGEFPFEYLSSIAERERHRKELARPIYHIHKWWAQRLGSVFRGLLIGGLSPVGADVARLFYEPTRMDSVVFDPFMGSGTSVGEAVKLGARAIGRDINPVAAFAVSNALSQFDRAAVVAEFRRIESDTSAQLRAWYRTRLPAGDEAEVLYYFWVMTAPCLECGHTVDLFSSRVFARHAYALRNPGAQAVCPECGSIEGVRFDATQHVCTRCRTEFQPQSGAASGRTMTCTKCGAKGEISRAIASQQGPPRYRLYAKLVLTASGEKVYLPTGPTDLDLYQRAMTTLAQEASRLPLPRGGLADGQNTRQAMNYGYTQWREFFNGRQLLCLGLLADRIRKIEDSSMKNLFLCLFSGALEFNNMFASYKGEGTGAIRHMFSHHILKPERQPIEGNVWGTAKSSGSFSSLFRSRLLPALDYATNPFELRPSNGRTLKVYGLSEAVNQGTSDNYAEFVESGRPYISVGDSASTDLPDDSVDLVLTDPPFFDNVNYSELADFFHSWQVEVVTRPSKTTRSESEVQHASAEVFSGRLQKVLLECNRVLRSDGLLVFTYHHSRVEGWRALALALTGAHFRVVACHPILSEMLAATPKRQSAAPIQIDLAVVCRASSAPTSAERAPTSHLVERARTQVRRLNGTGLLMGPGDVRVILMGQGLLEATSMDHAQGGAWLDRFSSETEPRVTELVAEQRMPEPNQPTLLAV